MDISLSLTDELAAFVEMKMASGRLVSTSEVIQEALRLMQQTEKLADLRKSWQDGIDSGEPEELDFADLKAEGRTSSLHRARMS